MFIINKKMKKSFIVLVMISLLLLLFGCKVSNNKITEEVALTSIKNYCYAHFENLKEMEDSDNFTINWEVVSSDDKQIVVMFRSYTGAQVRYYIDKGTGETYVTEFMPGITENEEKTGEVFNINDWLE